VGEGKNVLYRSILAGSRSMLGARGFPNLDFRIPNSVWRMGDPEYRTMYSGTAGAGAGRGRADPGGV